MDSLHETRIDDPRIDSYLSDVESAMIHVPRHVRVSLTTEIRSHLESLIDAFVEVGQSPDLAVDEALSTMGEASVVGGKYDRTWYRRTEPGSILSALGIMVIAGSVTRAVFGPVVLAAHAAYGADYAPAVEMLGMLSQAAGGSVAGWYAPKGAVKAAWITVALSVCGSVTVMAEQATTHLAGGSHVNALSTFGLSLVLPAINVGAASIARRFRARKAARI